MNGREVTGVICVLMVFQAGTLAVGFNESPESPPEAILYGLHRSIYIIHKYIYIEFNIYISKHPRPQMYSYTLLSSKILTTSFVWPTKNYVLSIYNKVRLKLLKILMFCECH